MKYKIGDRVKLKDLKWYNENKNDDGTVIINNNDYEFDVYFTKEDSQFCGEIFTISDTYGKCYIFEEMEYGFPYCDEMIECLVN